MTRSLLLNYKLSGVKQCFFFSKWKSFDFCFSVFWWMFWHFNCGQRVWLILAHSPQTIEFFSRVFYNKIYQVPLKCYKTFEYDPCMLFHLIRFSIICCTVFCLLYMMTMKITNNWERKKEENDMYIPYKCIFKLRRQILLRTSRQTIFCITFFCQFCCCIKLIIHRHTQWTYLSKVHNLSRIWIRKDFCANFNGLLQWCYLVLSIEIRFSVVFCVF